MAKLDSRLITLIYVLFLQFEWKQKTFNRVVEDAKLRNTALDNIQWKIKRSHVWEFFSSLIWHTQSILLILLCHTRRWNLQIIWDLITTTYLLRTYVPNIILGILGVTQKGRMCDNYASEVHHLSLSCIFSAPALDCVQRVTKRTLRLCMCTPCWLGRGLMFVLQNSV